LLGCKTNGRRLDFRLPQIVNRRASLDRTAEGGCPHTSFASRELLPYAALLGALASTVFSVLTLTLICFGLASAFLGRVTFNTPLS
jgi:hypothetical protein